MKFQQPIWPRFLTTATVLGFATLGPIGRKLPAPGTWGSVAGLLYFTVFFYPLGIVGTLIFSAIGAYLAVALCGEAEFRLARKDPGEVILDEFIAIPLCFLGWRQLAEGLIPPSWVWIIFLVGLGLFRVFDILKPFGIRRLQELPGGWGVVVDDVVAALATCAVMHGAKFAWVKFMVADR
jgi:phosphatidylglycerophosphatase A